MAFLPAAGSRSPWIKKAKPDGRQVVLQIWDAALDLPLDDGEPVNADIPCNICSMLKVRDNRLEWSQIMRSNDIFKGLPYNFIQFTTLQDVLAGWIGIEPGAYTHFAGSLHLYEVDAENAFSSEPVLAASLPDSLALPKHQADPIRIEMNRRVDLLVQDGVGAREYKNLAQIADAPVAFSGLMAIVVADAARRRGFVDEMNEAVAVCANPLMKQLWVRWANRWSSGI